MVVDEEPDVDEEDDLNVDDDDLDLSGDDEESLQDVFVAERGDRFDIPNS